ncbi:MAG: hypothetical protein QXL82_03205 [Candidatus Aenigmatarchaeota archaeon]
MLTDKKLKGFTAIEIIFIIFILIVVVLVVIQMVTRYVSPSKINPYIENIEELAKKDYMRQYCDNLCNAVKTATSEQERLFAMARWCMENIRDRGKDYVDIIEDGVKGFYVIGGLPYCEAGTYCFHFFSCDVGITLDVKECRRILCEYYYRQLGDSAKATEAILKIINWGRCKVDTTQLSGKPLLYESASWWYNKYFNITDEGGKVKDFCRILLASGTI